MQHERKYLKGFLLLQYFLAFKKSFKVYNFQVISQAVSQYRAA